MNKQPPVFLILIKTNMKSKDLKNTMQKQKVPTQ